MNNARRSFFRSINPDEATKRLICHAARIARIFDPQNPSVRPEFVVAALPKIKTGICRELFSYILEGDSDFNALLLVNLAESYQVKLSEVIYQIQQPGPRLNFHEVSIDGQLREILVSARTDWKAVCTNAAGSPMPVDFFLAALLLYKGSLDIFDLALLDTAYARGDLFAILQFASDVIGRQYKSVLVGDDDPGETVQRPEAAKPVKIDAVENHLRKTIIGQSEAIDAVMRAIKADAAGLKEAGKPIGVLLFAGMTGVGKTEVARQLGVATGLPLERLDMSEFAERHTVARLYGSPPGYVGYEEGGQLTNFVMMNPASIVVFDEVDKADLDVLNVVLQIAEEGNLTDGLGRTVSFDRTIVILTTNVGASEASRAKIGFSDDGSRNAAATFEGAIRRFFRSEFLGRLSDCVIFRPLCLADVRKIAALEIGKLARRVKANRGIRLKVKARARDQIVGESDVALYGARDLKNTLAKKINAPLADYILSNGLGAGDSVTVSYGVNGYGFSHNKSP
jgi:hypothetical protein